MVMRNQFILATVTGLELNAAEQKCDCLVSLVSLYFPHGLEEIESVDAVRPRAVDRSKADEIQGRSRGLANWRLIFQHVEPKVAKQPAENCQVECGVTMENKLPDADGNWRQERCKSH